MNLSTSCESRCEQRRSRSQDIPANQTSQSVSLCCPDLQYVVDCSQVNNLPTLSFVISGTAFPLPPSAYIIQVSYCIRATMYPCGFIFPVLMCTFLHLPQNQEGYQTCAVGITPTYLPSRDGEPLWIFGDVFLREYYSVYDRTNNRVGFAVAA